MKAFDLLVAWGAAKDRLSDTLDLSRPLLHLHGGLALYVLACVLLRAPLGDRRPLLIVLVLELLNEGTDIVRYHVSGWPWTPHATLVDLIDTLLWPVILTLLARRRPRTAA